MSTLPPYISLFYFFQILHISDLIAVVKLVLFKFTTRSMLLGAGILCSIILILLFLFESISFAWYVAAGLLSTLHVCSFLSGGKKTGFQELPSKEKLLLSVEWVRNVAQIAGMICFGVVMEDPVFNTPSSGFPLFFTILTVIGTAVVIIASLVGIFSPFLSDEREKNG